MKIKAYAKINLTLNVIGKTDNGYHQLDMINALISLHDVIKIRLIRKKVITCICNWPINHNLAVKAAQLFFQEIGYKRGAKIKLKKRIMSEAGLGGGSSDAAAVLLALNKMTKANLSLERLIKVAQAIGSDVPFFLQGNMCRVQGIGEKLTPLKNDLVLIPMIIVKPKSGVSTKECYMNLDWQSADRADIDKVISLIENGEWDTVPFYIDNALQKSACQLNSEIKEVLRIIKRNDLSGVLMSGSGSSCFGFDVNKTKKELKQIEKELKLLFPHVHLVDLVVVDRSRFYSK